MTTTPIQHVDEQSVLATEDEYIAAEVSRNANAVLVEGDVAIIFGTAKLRFAVCGKADAIQNLWYTSTDVKRQGRWRMRAPQMQQRAPN